MELARLEIGDIDADRCVVLIREGKGSKDRLVPLGERALHWVQKYLDAARPLLAWNAAGHDAVPGPGGHGAVARRGCRRTWSPYVERAELGKRGGCHLFRHTMATLMLEGGADIRFIQAMLGHAELRRRRFTRRSPSGSCSTCMRSRIRARTGGPGRANAGR